MAAIDLSGASIKPVIHRKTDISATLWQEYSLPPWATKVLVRNTDAANDLRISWLQAGFTGAETPADGGAVANNYLTIAAGAAYVVQVKGTPMDEGDYAGEAPISSFFLVGDGSNTGKAEVVLEGAP